MTITKEKVASPQAETRRPYRFSYGELLEMAKVGILDNARVEIIDGEIIEMLLPNPPHAIISAELDEALTLALASAAKVSGQNPLRLSADMNDKNLPLPDILAMKRRVYLDHPQAEDVYFLVEVSDNSLREDKTVKLELYAQHGIKEYWIVNLVQKGIEVYSNPSERDYKTRKTYGLSDTFAPLSFPEVKRQWLPEEVLKALKF